MHILFQTPIYKHYNCKTMFCICQSLLATTLVADQRPHPWPLLLLPPWLPVNGHTACCPSQPLLSRSPMPCHQHRPPATSFLARPCLATSIVHQPPPSVDLHPSINSIGGRHRPLTYVGGSAHRRSPTACSATLYRLARHRSNHHHHP